MKKYIIIVILVFLQINAILCTPIYASEKVDASIKLLSEKTVFVPNFNSEVEVEFLDKRLYNKDIFVSYHIYDKNDKEILFEGMRLPVKVDEFNRAKVKFSIDLTKGIDLKKYQYLKVRFDMVDQHNLYWFSKNKNIKISSSEIIYENNFIKKAIFIYTKLFKEQPIILTVNVLVFVTSIYFIFKVKKKYIN